MKKVIKIKGANYQVETNYTGGSTCSQCEFFIGDCPRDTNEKALCWKYGDSAYFVAEPTKPLVEEFKEAAGITAEQTFTISQVRVAYAEFTNSGIGEVESFIGKLKRVSDPEYKEYLRLKAKFQD